MSQSPTSLSLAECRKRGWPAQVVERIVPKTFIRVDLFGCIDIIALDGEVGVLGIQATTRDNAAARMAKARGIVELRQWLVSGNRFAVWSWAKTGKAGKRKLWTLREDYPPQPDGEEA